MVAVFSYYFFIYEAPTCTDGILNQDEQEIDCGGVCPKICHFEAIEPIILWTRFFEVKKGIYNVVAMVENPNLGVEAFDVPYAFKIYDENNVLLAERFGKTYIPPRGMVPVFERTIITREKQPGRSPAFEFLEQPVWLKILEEKPVLTVFGKEVSEKDGATKLEATIRNDTVRTIKGIKVTGVITNKDGNAIAVSQTEIRQLVKNASEVVTFTWPGLLEAGADRIEIITVIEE